MYAELSGKHALVTGAARLAVFFGPVENFMNAKITSSETWKSIESVHAHVLTEVLRWLRAICFLRSFCYYCETCGLFFRH